MPIKYLNLDDLATAPQRFLKLGDVEHPIVEQSVEIFIEETRLIEAVKDGKEDDFVNQVELSIRFIKLYVPSIDESLLRKLPLSALRKISAFIRGHDEDEVAAEVESESEKK